MATIDRLDIQIEGSAQKANVAINDLIKNLDRLANSLKIDTSGLEKIGKSLNLSGIDKAAKNMQSQTQKVSKSLSQITEQYKDLGKGFEIKGSTQQIQKQIDSLTNKLANAKLAKDDFEASGKTNLGGYENAVKNVIKYTNQIESLKKQLEGLQTAQPRLDFNVAGAENATKYLIEYKKQLMDFKNDMKSIGEVYGGLQNVPKGGLDTPIQNLKQSIEELKQSYPQATNVISTFEKELQKLQGISSGLTKEPIRANIDTSSIDKVSEKIAELKNRFEKVGSDFKFTGNFEQLNIEIEKVYSKLNELRTKEQEMISAGQVNTSGFEQLQESLARVGNKFGIMQDLRDRTEAFNQSLKQLRVPEIREENLTKLQNSLRKTEENTEKLRTKLSNAITMGRIVPNIDDSGFRKLTEQIALSEKQAEALRQKIQEVGGDTSETGSFMDRLKTALSSVSSQSNKTSSATNILGKNIKKLSSSMSGFSKSAGKAVTGLKSFTKQVLSGMGIYLGVYGAIRGIKKSIDISSDLTEVQNVVDVTFGDMAYKVEEFAKTSIEQFGMSELALKQYSSRFQAMGSAMGISSKSIGEANSFLESQTNGYIEASDSMSDVSLNLTKLTADMASFYNVEQKAVAEDLAAIFTGMSRPLRTYGLDLTQATLQEWAMKNGLDANIQSMSQAEKTMLRYQYVLANTKAAQGDFARTANTWANQTRILKQNFEQLAAIIGGVLVNAFKPVVKMVNAAMSHIISFAKTISNALGQIFGWTYEEGGGGLAQDFEGAAEGAEDLSDSTGTAAKNIEKMKKGIRAFDELKTIDLPEPADAAGGGGGGSGAGIGGSEEVDGGGWNPGESIIKKFTSEIDSLYKLGEYIGDTLKDTLNGIDWESVYKSARNFGKGLADFLNGLISPELFSSVGKTIAGALNTALHFLDSFGETFDFTNFGISIGAGINAALRGIDWETALSAAKKWGTGIAKTINGFLKRTDFSLVGSTVANVLNTAIQFALSTGKELDFKKIGLSIANGINGFFKTLRVDKLAKTINIWVKGALKTVSTLLKKTDFDMIGKKIGKFLAELDLIGALKGLASVIWEAIKGSFSLLSGIFKSAPLEASLLAAFSFLKFTKVGQNFTSNLFSILSGGATQALKKFSSYFNGGLFGVIGTAVAAFAEFSVVSDALENLTLGTENLLTGIGKIAGVVSIAGAAMYAALGPAGIAIAAITGVVAAIKGINDAMEKIRADDYSQKIHDALSSPGGVSISELTDGVVESIGNIGDQFSTLSEKSNELDNAEKNIEDIKSQIQLVEEELKAGVITTEEAKIRLTDLLDELTNAIKTKLELSNAYIVSAFGEGGAWTESLENAGKSSEEFMGTVLGVSGETLRQIEELEKQMQGVEVGSPEWYKLYDEMLRVSGQMDELDKGITNFETEMSTLEIDYSGLLADEGELDPQQLEDMMSRVSKSVEDAQAAVEVSGKELVQNLTQKLQEAKSQENQEAVKEIEAMIGVVEEGIVRKKKGITEQAKQLTDTLQSGLVDKIKKVGEDAYAAWDSMTSTEKAATGMPNATSYADEMIRQYTEKVINPFSDSVEENFKTLGIEGAGWSGQAAKEASEAFTNYNWFEKFGDNMSSKDLSDVLKGVISKATKDIKGYTKTEFGKTGKAGVEGTREGINKNLSLVTGAVGNMANQMLSKARETLGVHSPSTKFKEIGGYVVEGMKGGISGKWAEFSDFWTKKYDSVVSTFENIETPFNKRGKEAVSGLKGGVGEKWPGFIADWVEKKDSIIGKYDSIGSKMDTKGRNAVMGLKSGVKEKWDIFDTYWTGRKDSVVDKFKNINTDFQGKGKDIVSGLETGISNNWDGFVGWWADKIKAMVNGILDGINWVLKKVGSSTQLDPWEPKGFAKGANGLPQDTIGIVNDQKGNVYKELIVPPHGKPFIPEGRNVMLPMKKGTKIMPARQTKDFMEKMNGMPHFAGGIGDFFKGAWAKISEFTGNIWDYISNPGKILQIAFDKFTDLSGMLEPVLSIAKGAASTLLDGATGFIKKMFDENLTVQYNPSKGVEQWRGLATKALQMTGHFSALNLELMMKQIQTESSGNPRAINLYDANAKRGTPSKGILQVIDPTFRAFALAPYNKDIWDPLSNMLAAIRYVVSKDGGIVGNWGKNKGYASGIGKINIADLIPQYRNGGFPEDGLFYANHNEVIGRFSNGQTAVANNGQITQGFAEAIYPAVYNAVSSAIKNNGLLNDILEEVEKGHEITLDGEPVYKKMVKRAKEDMRSGRNGRLVVAEELY